MFKDTCNMGFLGVTEPILELELERRLVEKIKQFLLELGQGFTYIGNQHVLNYRGKEHKVDMKTPGDASSFYMMATPLLKSATLMGFTA